MKALFIDTETSGLPLWKLGYHDPRQPWVCQIAAVLADAERVYDIYSVLVKADGRQIEPEAAAITGITPEMCDLFGIEEPLAIRTVSYLTARADVLVCHNVNFDRMMVAGMYCRNVPVGADVEKYLTRTPWFCTMESTTDLLKLPGNFGKHKWPKLEELYLWLFQEPLLGAHDAFTDTMATRRCFFELLKRELITLPALRCDAQEEEASIER